jgi:hypothetical protein
MGKYRMETRPMQKLSQCYERVYPGCDTLTYIHCGEHVVSFLIRDNKKKVSLFFVLFTPIAAATSSLAVP